MKVVQAVLVDPIIILLRFLFTEFHAATADYGASLVLLSLSVTLITAPLYYLAERWRRVELELRWKMSRELSSIRKHYEGQKRFYLTRNVHRLHGYSPLLAVRASLGLFVQIPFFFAAYFYLSHQATYAGAGLLFIKDLGKPDGLLGGVNALPIVMTAINITSALVYTRTTSLKGNGPLLALSAFFLVVLYDEPAALLVYWTMNNVFSLVKNIFFPANGGKKEPIVLPDEPGALSRAIKAIRSLYDGSLAVPALVAGCALVLAAQNWWLIHHASSYENCVIATFVLAAGLSVAAVAVRMRGPRAAGIVARMVALAASWASFAVSAYFLLYARRQNAYISNPNIKMLSTVLLDLCACVAAIWIARGGSGVPRERAAKGDHAFFFAGVSYLFLFIFVLSPLQIYFSSPKDVGMTPWVLLGRNLPALVVAVTAAFGLGLLLERSGRRLPAAVFFSAITVALSYAVISAGLYGVLDEFALQKAFLLDTAPVWYFLLDVAILTGAAILGRYLWLRKRWIIMPALVVLAMGGAGQIAAAALRTAPEDRVTASAVPSAGLPPESQIAHRFSTSGRNVVFIIADMFNGNYMGRVLDERPAFKDLLDGFVWYPNVVSVSSVTATSLPGIYGGWEFAPRQMNGRPGTGTQKLRQAAEKFFGGVEKRGYEIAAVDSLYADLPPGVTESDSSSYVSYWKTLHNGAGSDLTDNPKNALLSMLTLFRSVPFSLKARVYDNGSWILFRKSYQFQYIARRTLRTYAYLDLLPQLSSIESGGNTFKFIHTQFTHEPFGVKADGAIISDDFPDSRTKSFIDGTSAYYTARRFMEFLSRWLEWLKKGGVYDNTLIIVISDHGNNANDNGIRLPASLDNPFDRADLSRARALVLVKRFGARGAVRTDPRLMSNADAPAIFFNAIGGGAAFGEDPTEGPSPAPRMLEYAPLQGAWEDFLHNEKAGFTYYAVRGDVQDPRSWSKE